MDFLTQARKALLLLLLAPSIALSMDVAGIGDSLVAGHCLSRAPQTFLSAIENGWVESGDTNMSPMHVLLRVSGGSITTTNLGHGSYKWEDLHLSVKQYIPAGTKVVFVHCGINDVAAATDWATVLTYMNAVKTYCNGLGAKFIIDDIFPDAGISDAQALVARTWNTNYHQWASTNGSYTLQDHDAMGQLRVSTGFLDDLNTAYYCAAGADSVHLNTNGVAVWTTNIWGLVKTLIQTGGNYYVGTSGSDTNDGSMATPYATLSNAVVKALSNTGFTDQKNIYLYGGSYYNTTAYVQGYLAGIGGGNMLITAYTNGVKLYGGQPLTGWTDNGDGTFTASLGTFPGTDGNVSRTTDWQPRTLLADDVQVRWAEYPDATISGTNKLYFTNDPTANFSTISYTNTMGNTTNNEVSIDNSWNDAQLEVTAIDTGTHTLTLNAAVDRGGGNQLANDVRTYTLRNGPEGMLNPNTFWWNKTNNTIIFKPPTGKNPSSMTVIVPTSTKIIYLYGGTGTAGNILTNIVISNLTLSCTTAIIGDGVKKDPGMYYDGAIDFQYTTNCVIDRCVVYGCANHGIAGGSLVGGHNNGAVVRNCIVHDCGAGGIAMPLSGVGNVISNNLIYNMGGLVKCAPGICPNSGAVGGTNWVISNTISNCDGAGVFSAAGQNHVVTKNWISTCVKQLRDMGGIYMQNVTPLQNSQNIIAGNYVENIHTTNSINGGVWDPFVIGIYLDSDVSNSLVYANIEWNCAHPVMNYHCGTSNLWLNNIFVNPDYPIGLDLAPCCGGNCDPGTAVNLANNILYSFGTPTIYGPTDKDQSAKDWTGNIWYIISGSTTYLPTNATAANPLFVKVPTTSPQYLEDADFRFQAGSPAPGLGIQPLSLAGIGYNGGLGHRPSSINVGTLRVGTIRGP